jgi:hypothetical protein
MEENEVMLITFYLFMFVSYDLCMKIYNHVSGLGRAVRQGATVVVMVVIMILMDIR